MQIDDYKHPQETVGVPELREWMHKQRLSEYKFARRYKLSQPFLNQIINGRRKASKKTILFIEEISHGEVNRRHLRRDLYGRDNEPNE